MGCEGVGVARGGLCPWYLLRSLRLRRWDSKLGSEGMASSSVVSDVERTSSSEVLAASGGVSEKGDVGDGESGVSFSAMSIPVTVVSLGGDQSGEIGEATTTGVSSPVADSLPRGRCSKAQ